MTLGLGNIHALLEAVGHPQREFRTVVVAGTNGKGSVVSMTASLLRAQGLRVGRYTSPHVYSVNERVWFDGASVTVDEMERAAERVRSHHDAIGFSYFEALTAIAFLVFAERGVDIAVLETGLGGRFDATNVTNPEVTVVTSIAVDHRRILGDTEEEILREKLGITRAGVPLLLGRIDDGLRAIVDERAARDGFPVVGIDDAGSAHQRDVGLDGVTISLTTPRADYGEVVVPYPGAHQVTNALLAVAAAERVSEKPLRDVARGLGEAYLPGRFERVRYEGKTFIVDVAHNDAALLAAADHLAATSERSRTAVVLGLMRRKELFSFPRRMLEVAGRVYLVAPATRSPETAFAPPELYSNYVATNAPGSAVDVLLWHRNDGEAWDALIDKLSSPINPCDVIYVAGSHHVVDAFGRRLWAREKVA